MTRSGRVRSLSGCRPLYATARTPGRKTLGPRVTQVSELLGKPFMPWQRMVADVALEVLPGTGENGVPPMPAYDAVCLVVMRQQGKTEFVLPLMTHRATGFGPSQRILYTTQTKAEARLKWEDIHVKRLESSPLRPLFTVRRQASREAILWANGSAVSPGAPTYKGSGTGDTLDLGIIDEAWSHKDGRLELGMRPAMATRANRQLWACSMVPGATRAKGIDSVYLRSKIRQGRAMVAAGVNRGMAYFEFGAPEGSDPADPATWWGCMPALGHTITQETVQSDFDALTAGGDPNGLVDFQAEYLSLWPMDHVPVWQTIRKSVWTALRDRGSKISKRFALAIDANLGRSHAYIGVCGKRFDGDYHAEIVEPGDQVPLGTLGLEWVLPRAMEIIDRHDPLCVVIDPKGAAASLILPLQNAGYDIVTPNLLQVAAACGRLYDATGQEAPPAEAYLDEHGEIIEERPTRIRHIGQPELSKAVAGARKYESPTDGTFRWARVASAHNISPLYCITLAMLGYDLKAHEDYDVLDSVA